MRRTWGGAAERRRAREAARGESAPWRRGGKGARPLSLSGRGIPQPPAILLPPPFCGPTRPLSTVAFLRITELQNHSIVCIRRGLTAPQAPHQIRLPRISLPVVLEQAVAAPHLQVPHSPHSTQRSTTRTLVTPTALSSLPPPSQRQGSPFPDLADLLLSH